MQAATMTPDLMMVGTAATMTVEARRAWMRKALAVAFVVVGVAATAWILGQFGTLMVYGLPAPFISRIPARFAEAA